MGIGSWLFSKLSKYYTKQLKASNRAYLCDFDRICHEIIPGDVLLIEGNNRVSRRIKSITHSPWTHAALYIGRLHSIVDPKIREIVRKNYHGSAGDQLLLDTLVGLGTFITPVSKYENDHIRICRPTGISHTDAQKVINFAIKHVGHTYDTRHLLDLGRFLIFNRWFMPKRWRSSLFSGATPSQTSKDICSSLIADAFISVRFPIIPYVRSIKDDELEFIQRNPKLYTPSDFDYSPYFSIIKYPIYPYKDHGPYHHLPWREDLLSQDGGVVTSTEKKPSDKNE